MGTRLVTGHDQPALGGVYKLAALRDPAGRWEYRLKLSEQDTKQSEPGILQVRRLRSEAGQFVADMIYDELAGLPDRPDLVLPGTHETQRLPESAEQEDLLVPVFRGGLAVSDTPSAAEARERAAAQFASFDPRILQLQNPESYLVGLEQGLHRVKCTLIAAVRQGSAAGR